MVGMRAGVVWGRIGDDGWGSREVVKTEFIDIGHVWNCPLADMNQLECYSRSYFTSKSYQVYFACLVADSSVSTIGSLAS